MKQFQLKVSEDELKALIQHHANVLTDGGNWQPDITERLHNLMKRLHKDTPDIEKDSERDETEQQQDNKTANAAPAVAGWPTATKE